MFSRSQFSIGATNPSVGYWFWYICSGNSWRLVLVTSPMVPLRWSTHVLHHYSSSRLLASCHLCWFQGLINPKTIRSQRWLMLYWTQQSTHDGGGKELQKPSDGNLIACDNCGWKGLFSISAGCLFSLQTTHVIWRGSRMQNLYCSNRCTISMWRGKEECRGKFLRLGAYLMIWCFWVFLQ